MDSAVVRIEKKYPCCKEPYLHLMYTFTIARKSPTYRAIIITPAIGKSLQQTNKLQIMKLMSFAVLMLLTLLNFWLPPHSGEKIVLNGCVTIIISIFLLYFGQKIPAMGSTTPLIGNYIRLYVFRFGLKKHFYFSVILQH